MDCNECGKEIKDEEQICSFCGAKVNTGKKKKRIKILILVGISILCILFFFAVFEKYKRVEDAMLTGSDEYVSEESTTQEMVSVIDETDIKQTESEETVEALEEAYEWLVCVPVEHILLRKTPGFGNDVIAELSPGTYMKWYGERKVVGGLEYYKVVIGEDELEGYLAARYCVNVEYKYAEEDLQLVETDTSLYTYEMMVEDIEELCSRYPKWLHNNVIGTSLDGRNLYEIVLGNPNAKKHIMLQAGIHGREYMTSQLVMKMVEYYAYYYESGEFENISYKALFDKVAFHIVPMSNPDGVTISQVGTRALNNSDYKKIVYECYLRDKDKLAYEGDANGDMNWMDYYKNPYYKKSSSRKKHKITFGEYQKIWKANAAGVDLNNNFDADWERIDLKKQPSYGSFKGTSSVSEPESRALVKVANSRDYECFMSYHARGQLIYYDVKGNTRKNSQASLEFANLLDSWIKYEPVNTKNAYNVNLGGFGDWVQLSKGKPSVTIECGKHPCPLEIEEFVSIWNRHRESWAMLAKQYYE